MEEYFDRLLAWGGDKARDILLALVFLIVGFKVVKLIIKGLRKSVERTKLEKSVAGFLMSLLKWGLDLLVIITAASMVGFQVTSLVALLGATGLTIGMALQGSLANLVGGLLILVLKPFRVGDYIIENEKGCEGTVISIDIFYTRLRSVDQRVIIIPNGNIMSNSLVNVTAEKKRRVTITVGVSYDADILKVKDVLYEQAKACSYTIKDDLIETFVSSFGDSAVMMGVRCFVKVEDYWPATWALNESIKLAFDAEGIDIPVNQMEVKVHQ